MMKTILSAFIALIMYSYSYGQYGSVSGVLLDSINNQVLNHTSIYFKDLRIGTITNDRGEFLIDSIPIGKHKLQISSIEYGELKLEIEVIEDSTIYIKVLYPLPCNYVRSKKKPKCPICGKKNKVIPIVYGFPSPGYIKMVKRKKVVLGGCVIKPCQPYWFCKRESLEF